MTRPSSVVTAAALSGVVPQVGSRRLGLELGPALLELLEPEVALGLGQPALASAASSAAKSRGASADRPVRRRHGRT